MPDTEIDQLPVQIKTLQEELAKTEAGRKNWFEAYCKASLRADEAEKRIIELTGVSIERAFSGDV